MADNLEVSQGTGTTVAADDVGGVLYQRVKIGVGADGTATDVSTANPLPVSDAGGSLTVDGTVAATQSGAWNVATVSTVTAVTGITNAVAVTGPLTDTQLRATPIAVTDNNGSLTVDIASAAWTDFCVDYVAADSTGNHTTIAAPGTGYKLQFQEVTAILGEAGENVIKILKGATQVRTLYFTLEGEGMLRVWAYPDYWTLPENTALVANNSAAKKWSVMGQYRVVAV